MSWARELIAALARGETVVARPRGHSMTGRVADGQRVRIAPLHAEAILAIDDVVLCHVAGRDYLHLIKAIRVIPEEPDGSQYLIGNNRGGLNGWVRRSAVFGRMLGDAAAP